MTKPKGKAKTPAVEPGKPAKQVRKPTHVIQPVPPAKPRRDKHSVITEEDVNACYTNGPKVHLASKATDQKFENAARLLKNPKFSIEQVSTMTGLKVQTLRNMLDS